MNGEPLPPVHGYPVRMVVPGLYGYVSATKWLVDIELTTFDAYDPYWVQRGWAGGAHQDDGKDRRSEAVGATRGRQGRRRRRRLGPTPRHRSRRGPRGRRAWARPASAEVDSIDTWRQWTYEWTLLPGNHALEVRATDRDGVSKRSPRNEPFPNGATGWHSVVVTVA